MHHWTPEKKSTKYSGFLNQMRCISIALNTHTYKTQLMLSARAARAVGAVASVFNIEESVKHFGFNRVIEFQVL